MTSPRLALLFVAAMATASVHAAESKQCIKPDEYPTGEKIRVACVGDSITWGDTLEAIDRWSNCYPTLLQGMLGDRYEVWNMGISGHTMLKNGDKSYWKYIEAVDKFQPHVIILKLGSNDSKPQNWVHKAEFAANYREMIQRFKAYPTHPKIWVCLPASVIKDNFGINEKTVQEELPMIRQVAAEENVPVIDIYSVFKGHPERMSWDGVHPNEAGARAMAETIFPCLGVEPAKVASRETKIDTK
jgi:lysophospholipase L1-like esterase